MPFLFHIDLKSLYFYASLLGDGITNIYLYMYVYKDILSYSQEFVYPPPIFLLQGAWYILAQPLLGPEFVGWLENWGAGHYMPEFLFRYLFILKIPNLFFDLLIGWLLYKMVPENIKNRVLLLWFFNPITLYINYGLANFDIVPTFLVVLALYYYHQNKFLHSGLSLGVATAFKVFPLILWPFFVVSAFKTKNREKAMVLFGGAYTTFALLNIPWLENLLPVYNSGLTNKALAFKIPFLPFELPVLYILLIGLFLFFYFKKNYDFLSLAKYIFCALLIMLSITSFHPQWWMWLMPFFVILAAQNLLYLVVFAPILAAAALLIIGLNDQFITIGILNPLIPTINNSSFLHDFVFKYKPELLLSIAKITLITCSLILIVLLNLKLNLKFPKLSSKLLFTLMLLVTLSTFVAVFSLGILSSSRKILASSVSETALIEPVYKGKDYIRDIPVSVSGIYLVNVNLKNVNLQNSDPFNVTIDNNAGEKREFKLTGGNIGDEQWLNLRIAPMDIPQKMTLRLSSETSKEVGTQSGILVMEDVNHNTSYQLFKRENPLSQIPKTGELLINNLNKDPYFLYFYLGLITVLTGSLAYTFLRRR